MDMVLDALLLFPRTTPVCPYDASMSLLLAMVVGLGIAIGYGIAKCENPQRKYHDKTK